MRIKMLIGAALVLSVSAPAYAVDLYSSALYSGSGGHDFECLVLNSGTTNIKVTLQLIDVGANPDTAGLIKKCGPTTIVPQDRMSCFYQALGQLAYCRVTTTSTASTEAIFAVLDSSSQTLATSIPR